MRKDVRFRVLTAVVLGVFLTWGLPVGASGGAVTTVLLDERNGSGRLRVVKRFFEATDRTLLVAPFLAADGSVTTWTCDSLTEECVASLPWGSVVTRSLANGTFEVGIHGSNQLLWAGTADGQGNVTSDASQLSFAIASLASQYQGVLQALRDFGVTQGHLAPQRQGFVVNPTKITAGCVFSIISFVYLYAGVLACTNPVACLAAVIVGHAFPVYGMAFSC